MFPMGPPSDFGGAIIPNPDSVQVLPDTQAPGARLTGGRISTDNFRGKVPIKTVSSPGQIDFSQYEQQPAASIDFSKYEQPKDDRSLLDHLANDPNNIPLDSYTHATERGLANIGQGVAQAVQGTGQLLRHPIDTIAGMAKGAAALPSQAAQLIKQPPTLAELGDVAGTTAGNLTAGVIGDEAGAAAVKGMKTAAPVISDAAKTATARAVTAAQKVTPKQAATAAGTAGGAVFGHGVTSAYFGSKFGHVAELLLGKERANLPIFQKAAEQGLSLDQLTDKVAELIANERSAARDATGQNVPYAGAEPPARSSAQVYRDATKQNVPFAGEERAAAPAAAADAGAAPKFTVQDRAAAKSLLEDALKTHTSDVIDQMVPGKNTAVKSRVDFYLKKGDVAGAESELDKGAKAWKNLEFDRTATKQASAENTAGTLPEGMTVVQRAQQLKEQMMSAAGTSKPAWTALDRQPVPSTNEIRARVQREANAPKPGSRADLIEDKGIDQQWQWHLDRHGWAAESEARREFIARNSTGMTKGELAKRFAAEHSGSAAQPAPASAAGSGTAADASAESDLTAILQKSLEQMRKPKAQQ